MRKTIFRDSLLLLVLVSAPAYAQVPVIPGASGFGITTPAGRGGKVIRVTDLGYDGPDTLKACIDASGPRVCVFEVSGAIDLRGECVSIRNSNITIAGQTAPTPGILIRNGGLKIATSDVLLQHIAIRVGDGPDIVKPNNADALKVETGQGSGQNVVIDHVSLSWSIDEVFSAYAGVTNITIRHSILSEGLHDSLHENGPHSKAAQFGENKGGIAMIGNLFAHNAERNPKMLTSDFVFASNVIYNYSTGGTNLAIPHDGTPLRHTLVDNLFIEGPNTSPIKPIGIRSYSDAISSLDSRIYLSGNRLADRSFKDQWELVKVNLSFSPKTDSAPVWLDGLQTVSAASQNDDSVLNSVLENAGTRPSDRNSVDKRIVAEVRQRGGKIINCVSGDGSTRCSKNAGGWPIYAVNRRSLTLPTSPNGDSNGNGYTNLEEWLHKMAAEVENGGANTDDQSKPQPPEILSAN